MPSSFSLTYSWPTGLSCSKRLLILLACVQKAIAAGDDKGDLSPAMADDGRHLVLQGVKLERIIPVAGAGMVRLGGDQVAACHQLVALYGGVVVEGPLIFFVGFGVVLDTRKLKGFMLRARLVLAD